MMRFIVIFFLTTLPCCLAYADDKPADPTPTVRNAIGRAGGAIVCRNLAMVAFMKQRVEVGVGNAPPNFSGTGCTMLPEGTPLTVENGPVAPIVSGETLLGSKVHGVTDPAMIEIK